MDHAALTTLRTSLQELQANLPTLTAPTRPVHLARAAATTLPTSETLRELRRLRPGATRITITTALAAHIPLSSLRRAALRDPSLLSPSDTTRAPPAPVTAAITALLESWRPLVATDPSTARLLDHLATRFPAPAPAPAPAAPPSTAPSAQLSALTAAISDLHARLTDAVTLCAGDAAGHDGLQEEVRATWGRVRARRAELATLRARVVEGAAAADAGERLRAGELVAAVDAAVRGLHVRRVALMDAGFRVREVSPGLGEEEEEEEDEWEDAVEVAVGPGKAQAEAEEAQAGAEAEKAEEEVLPRVRDWAKVMRGEEGRDSNRLILERLERQAGFAGGARGAEPASFMDNSGLLDAAAASRGGRGGTTGRGGRKRAQSTARQRLSKVLGIRKQRKKKLIDKD